MVREGEGAPGASIRLTTPRTPGTLAASSPASSQTRIVGADPARWATAFWTPTRKLILLVDSLQSSASTTANLNRSSGVISFIIKSLNLGFTYTGKAWISFT
jgi:hypothetical protein